MNSRLRNVASQYLGALRDYLANEQESVLERAYGVGRLAIAGGLGVLEMARVHQRALEKVLTPTAQPVDLRKTLRAAEALYLEALSPFEATQRGFRESIAKLRRLIATLEKRNVELADINHQLQQEITERRRSEKALRESEEHFRVLFEQARLMEENLRQLSNQILDVQEAERKRVSRELHDEVGQSLTAVNVSLSMVQASKSWAHPRQRRQLAEARRLLAQTMETVHRFARELRPAMLDELGLIPALRSYMKTFAQRTGLQIHFLAEPAAELLDGEQKTVLFRVAQESLTNVANHARAKQVDVTMRRHDDRICMEIVDNGGSFSRHPVSLRDTQRLGLLGMQERVRLIQGEFTVTPHPGKETRVRVSIPFKPISPVSAAQKTKSKPLPVPAPARDN